MNADVVIRFFVYATIAVLILASIVFYLKNFAKAIRAFRQKEYSIKLVLRCIGIFVWPLGAFMGVV